MPRKPGKASASLQRYLSLKKQVEAKQRRADQLAGSIEHLLVELRDEFKVESLDEARALLTNLTRKHKKLQAEFDDHVQAFEKEWKNELEV